MKKFISYSLITVFVVLTSYSTLAKSTKAGNPTPTPSLKPGWSSGNMIQERQRRKEELRLRIESRLNARQAVREENREERQASKEAKLLARQEKKLALIKAYFERMEKRIQAAITRLEKLISRIESRLAIYKTENPGIDTAGIQKQIEDAKTLLADAKIDLEATITSIDTVLSSNEPKTAFIEVRNSVKGVKTKLVEVHRLLVHVIGDIKGLRIGTK